MRLNDHNNIFLDDESILVTRLYYIASCSHVSQIKMLTKLCRHNQDDNELNLCAIFIA